jgi:xylulose-5-phosphate/fructose-6-phosphate phosphoketolase
VAPETPGSIHEGGELGYSLVHAYGAAFDNPDLIVACVIGDGEAETGPLAGSWHANKFLDAARDGAVLPILHLNGYKIANPTVLARIPHDELESLLRGYGYQVHTVEGDDPKLVHQQLAATMDTVIGEIHAIQRRARENGDLTRPAWPVIVLKTPKGWTGPKMVDGLPVEGTWRAHQVPIDAARTNPEHLAQLESWLRSYQAEELFDAAGTSTPCSTSTPSGSRSPPTGSGRIDLSASPRPNPGRDASPPDSPAATRTPEVKRRGGSGADRCVMKPRFQHVLACWKPGFMTSPSGRRLWGGSLCGRAGARYPAGYHGASRERGSR